MQLYTDVNKYSKNTLKVREQDGLAWLMVFNDTFNNMSVMSRRSVLLMEETGENHRHVASH